MGCLAPERRVGVRGGLHSVFFIREQCCVHAKYLRRGQVVERRKGGGVILAGLEQ